MKENNNAKFKAAKDALVSSLFELSKSASQTASCVVDFYNYIGEDDEEKLEAFTTLTEALRKLTGATDQLNDINHQLGHSADPKADEELATNSSAVAAVPVKKKAQRDPFAPKKPLTVFFAYSAYIRQSIIDERAKEGLPTLSSTEITQEISKKWNNLGAEEKAKWKQAYDAEMESYQKRKGEYLEAKKNGTFHAEEGFHNMAPVPLPEELGGNGHQGSGIDYDDEDDDASVPAKRYSDSSEKKKKKKKKDKKNKNASTSLSAFPSNFSL
ncbi:related to High mobility group protein 1 [Saccharomycodes ludwigii]|uniref:Related to High mobility group protein 1 n=1 Tax=Saccharomycodes ludwigii TaxID=36035 RepID=A0A376B7R5_9ASCO|nr:related to High mobility group protein 1 [Saccharomycodes ludwigii]